jgi:hypothetical protein
MLFLHPISKRLSSLFLVLITIAFLGMHGYAQCGGVYLRNRSTQQIPYSKVYLDNTADFDGDGKADLIASQDVSGQDSNRERLLVILGNGDGTFATGSPTVIDAPAGNSFDDAYVIAKINNDAHSDIVAFYDYSTDPGTMLVYLNNGDGTFAPPVITSGVNTKGRLMDISDINGDGNMDYIGWKWSGGATYSLGNGDGTFSAPTALWSNAAGYRGDYNGDGKPDWMVQGTLYINQGGAAFTTFDVSSLFTFNEVISGVADFNGDGKSDLKVASLSGTPTFAIFTATGTGFTRTDYTITTGANSEGISQIGNFAGNSAPDIIYTYRYQNKKVLYTNDGAGNLTRQDMDQRYFRYNFRRVARADFDGDGKEDVVQAGSKITNSHPMLPDVTSITFLKNVCDRPGQPRIVDFDGTGLTDLSFWNPTTGDWFMGSYILPGSGGPSESNMVNWGLGSHGDIPTPGDFDGDGVADRAVFRNSTGYWYIRRSSDAGWFVLAFGQPGDKPVAADYDGDTISDIAVWRPSDGTWYFWYMGTQQFSAVHFGANGDKPAPADFDGDLKTDAGVYRPSTGEWYYLKSSDGNFAAFRWGLSTDRPIPADFDGDGKADIAVHRESDGWAYILRSSNGSQSTYRWGLPGDIIQIGDFDGDFIADIGMFRPSDNTWASTSYPFAIITTYGTPGAVPTSSILKVE